MVNYIYLNSLATLLFCNRHRARPASVETSGQKGKGSGRKEFLSACQSAEGGLWGGSVSAIPLLRGRQNRRIFFSLIEKILAACD
ncbi:MAG: hypothetical protein HQ536_04765 [Parcubacteria group bacterium]|nr:hypothetical protein [Parcubacteria group bacterium]